jgi:hypothetical protein
MPVAEFRGLPESGGDLGWIGRVLAGMQRDPMGGLFPMAPAAVAGGGGEAAIAAAARKLLSAGEEGGTLQQLLRLPYVPARSGGSDLDALLGKAFRSAQDAETVHNIGPTARAATQQEAARVRSSMEDKPLSDLAADYLYGAKHGGREWYTGVYPQLQEEIGRLAEMPGGRKVDPLKDPALLAKFIASTSPQRAPLDNLTLALQSYARYLRGGRPEVGEGKTAAQAFFGGMPSHAVNLARSTRGEPIEGMKVANFLMNLAGSEDHATIDRWMVNTLLGKPTTAANVSDVEYQVASNRLKELAQIFGDTPQRTQAALWVGAKLYRDPRIADLLAQNMTPGQAVPAFRNVIAGKMEQLRKAVSIDPRIISPSVALGALLLEESKRENDGGRSDAAR